MMSHDLSVLIRRAPAEPRRWSEIILVEDAAPPHRTRPVRRSDLKDFAMSFTTFFVGAMIFLA